MKQRRYQVFFSPLVPQRGQAATRPNSAREQPRRRAKAARPAAAARPVSSSCTAGMMQTTSIRNWPDDHRMSDDAVHAIAVGQSDVRWDKRGRHPLAGLSAGPPLASRWLPFRSASSL